MGKTNLSFPLVEVSKSFLDRTATPSLLPVLSSFLQTSTAPWFKGRISFQLSRIPLRKDGVFQTITFLASQLAPSLGEGTGMTTDEPPITVNAIMQISRLLSSVPQDMSAETYFTNISPKLLSLLDGDDPDLKKTASYVIGNGILGKRAYGAPGTIGHIIFIQPVFEALNGTLGEYSALWLRNFDRDGSAHSVETIDTLNGAVLVSEGQLRVSINRLLCLSLLHPHPGLLRRLINPVFISLWGLYWYAKAHKKHWWNEQAFTLLQTFFSVSAGKVRFEKLVSHMLWSGGDGWTYGPGEEGGISIRKRDASSFERTNPIEVIDTMDDRVELLSKLLTADPQQGDIAGELFLYVSKSWLLGVPSNDALEGFGGSDDLQESLRKLVSAKVSEKLLTQYKDAIARHPTHILELISQLIESEISQRARKKHSDDNKKNDTWASIGNITSAKNDGDTSRVSPGSPDPSEALSATLSLLSTILTSPDFRISESTRPLLETIKAKLDMVLTSLPSSQTQAATTASMLLEFSLSGSLSPGAGPTTDSPRNSDINTHKQALANLTSELPPVQAEGLSLLSNLISKASPVLDVPATLTLLLSLITSGDDRAANDEFVYLNVIRLIGELASRHPKTVVKTLAERYADRNEQSTLDQRLKVGEALHRTVQDLGDTLTGEQAKILGETMLSVAGRRGAKPKAKETREKANQPSPTPNLEDGEDDENLESLGVETANLMNQLDDQIDSDAEDPERTAYSAKILQAWAAGAVSDSEPDDLRARASAISILASAIQTNLAGLGRSIASSSVDMALATLSLESDPESAIIRRAAVVLLLDLIKSLDSASEDGKNLGFGLSSFPQSDHAPRQESDGVIGNIPDMLRVLTFVESKEADTIVRGHLRVLIESLEAWVEKSILRGIGTETQPRFELGGKLAGLDIEPLSDSSRGRNRPRIEEIE